MAIFCIASFKIYPHICGANHAGEIQRKILLTIMPRHTGVSPATIPVIRRGLR